MIKILFTLIILVSPHFYFANLGLQIPRAEAAASEWRIVPNNEVCMITNAHFARPQIEVPADGKMYYGCCENCKTTIKNDPSSRKAIDPVSKKSIDKATATIAANAKGDVLYFENQASFNQFKKAASEKR